MKWPPSEFWNATPRDCLLAAGGLAKMREAGEGAKKKWPSKKEVQYWQEYFAAEKVKENG